jgi:hypothetical protein
MEPAGMVHALGRIRELLKSDGRLIDIHPSGEPPPIEVHIGEQATVVGWMRETDDFIEYAQASAAVSEAVQRGWFDVERKGTFQFATHADSISDLRDYLAKEWKDAILEEIVGAKAEELLSASERVGEVLVREHVCIARLRPGDLHGLA